MYGASANDPGPNKLETKGETFSRPANTAQNLTETYRVQQMPNVREQTRTMKVLSDADPAENRPDNWSVMLFNHTGVNHDPGGPAGRIYWAKVLVHEVGHVMGLRHRERTDVGDGIEEPRTQNIMYTTTPDGATDLDLLQVLGIGHSGVFI